MNPLHPTSAIGGRLRQHLARLAMGRRNEGWKCPEHWKEITGKRIALIKWDGIGDFVLATTFLHPFYRHAQAREVTFFCQDYVAPLAKSQFPRWNYVTVPQRTKPLKRIYRQLRLRQAWQQMEPFDLLVDLRSMRDTSDAVMASWIPARCKVALQNQYQAQGVAFAWEEDVYDQLLPSPQNPGTNACLDILHYRSLYHLFQPADGSENLAGRFPEWNMSISAQEQLLKRLPSCSGFSWRDPFLLVCPGSMEPIKEYPPEQLAKAIAQVRNQMFIPVVLGGSRQDQRTTGPLREALGAMETIVDLTGQLGLEEHAALVSMAAAVLAMDSATAHLAGALRRPSVIIVGGGHPGVFAPWGASETFRWLQHPLPCYGCNWVCVLDKPHCIRDISPESIAQNLLGVLRAAPPG